MFFLKAGFPSTERPKLVRATAANMFALCSICGEEVHLTTYGVIRNISNLVHGRYICPKCSSALARAIRNEDDLDEPTNCLTCPDRDTCAYHNFDENETEDDLNERNDEECDQDEAADDDREECCGDEPDDAEGCDAEEHGVHEVLGQTLLQGLILPYLRTGIMSFVL